MSLLVSLLNEGEHENALKLIKATPDCILTEVDTELDEAPTIFFVLKDETLLTHVLLQKPESAWSRNQNGDVPLHTACTLPNIELDVIEILLYAYPDGASTRNLDGKLPIHFAMMHITNPDIIACLVKHAPDALTYMESRNDSKPLHYACAFRSPLDTIRIILQEYPDAITETDRNGNYPLHLALAYEAPIEVCLYLLDTYEDIKENGPNSQIFQIPKINKKKAKFTLTNYQELNNICEIRDAKGRLPLHLCAQSKSTSLELLEKISALYPKAHILTIDLPLAMEESQLSEIEKKKEQKMGQFIPGYNPAPDINHRKGIWMYGKKAIHIAIKTNAENTLLNFFLKNALSEKYKDSMAIKKKSVDRSISKAKQKMAQRQKLTEEKAIIVHNNNDNDNDKIADKEGKDETGNTNKGKTINEIRERGEEAFQPNTTTTTATTDDDDISGKEDTSHLNGETLLHTAIEFNCSIEVMKSILRVVPQVIKEPNHDGKLPIHYAAWKQTSVEVASFLITQYREGLNHKDKKLGNLPLHYTLQYGPRGPHADYSLSNLLLTSCPGAVFQWNNAGFYPIHLAAKAQCPIALMDCLLKVCPYSYGFVTKNYMQLLPVDLALHYNACAPVISLLLGQPFRNVAASPDPKQSLRYKRQQEEDERNNENKTPTSSSGSASGENIFESEEERRELHTIYSLKSTLMDVQESYMEQGEEMRKLRERMHVLASEVKGKYDQVRGLQRDMGWRDDRIKILEREVKHLTAELDSWKDTRKN